MCSHQQIPERLKDSLASASPSKNQGTEEKAPEASQAPDPHALPDGSGSEPAVIEKLKPSPPKGYLSKWQDGQWVFVQDPRWSGGLFHGSAMGMNILSTSTGFEGHPVRPKRLAGSKFSTSDDYIGGGRGRSRGQRHSNAYTVHHQSGK